MAGVSGRAAADAAWNDEADLPPPEWGRPPMAAGPRAVLGAVLVTAVLVAGRLLVAPNLRFPGCRDGRPSS